MIKNAAWDKYIEARFSGQKSTGNKIVNITKPGGKHTARLCITWQGNMGNDWTLIDG